MGFCQINSVLHPAYLLISLPFPLKICSLSIEWSKCDGDFVPRKPFMLLECWNLKGLLIYEDVTWILTNISIFFVAEKLSSHFYVNFSRQLLWEIRWKINNIVNVFIML